MKIRFAVVTEVPDPNGTDVWQNLAVPMAGVWRSIGNLPEQVRTIDAMMLLALRTPVFHLGELLVLDADGREPHGLGRKPDKWGISIECFETIELALDRALSLKS